MLERIIGFLPVILLFVIPALIALRRAARQRRAARDRAAAEADRQAQAPEAMPGPGVLPQAPRPAAAAQYVHAAPLEPMRRPAARSAAEPPARGRSGNAGERTWRRLEALPPLQRAVAFAEILGRPRGLQEPGDLPAGFSPGGGPAG